MSIGCRGALAILRHMPAMGGWIAVVLAGTGAWAQSQPASPASPWQLTIGGGMLVHPTYEGSNNYHVDPWPVFDLNWNDRVSISTLDGIHLSAIKWGDFRLGVAGNLRFGRQPHDDRALNHLPRIKDNLELGGFVEYNPPGIDILFEVRNNILGEDGGTIAELEAHLQLQPTDRWGIEFGPNLSWADGQFMRRYFGIDTVHAPLSGYPAYHPGAGFKSVGLFLGSEYKLTEHWLLIGNATYSRLLGPASRSPLVKNAGDANQIELGLFLAYRF